MSEERRERVERLAREISEQHNGALGQLAWIDGYAAAREQAAKVAIEFSATGDAVWLNGVLVARTLIASAIRSMEPEEKDPAA